MTFFKEIYLLIIAKLSIEMHIYVKIEPSDSHSIIRRRIKANRCMNSTGTRLLFNIFVLI